MESHYTKCPRLYVEQDLSEGQNIELSDTHAHYLMTVLRMNEGEDVRVFNGRDGEFIGTIIPQSKKKASLQITGRLNDQPEPHQAIHLYFAPIKKDRMAFMIEKAVELGVTDLHPILTAYTENRKPNIEKIQAHIIEAAEQCERMDIPVLHPIENMVACKFYNPTFVAIEREEYGCFDTSQSSVGVMIGPEGGWSMEEKAFLLNHEKMHPVSLGHRILRSETAALFMLSRIV